MEIDSMFEDEDDFEVTLTGEEVVTNDELTKNNDNLRRYVARIKEIATAVEEQTASIHGNYQDLDRATRKQSG